MDLVIYTVLAVVLLFVLAGAFCRYVLKWSWRKYLGFLWDSLWWW